MGKTKKKKNENKRVPIVAILGHVDHGKTTILDKIREANVQECEAGGITQKISVFTVAPDCEKDERITFVDTPGHEAFDLMRLRGGSIADIVLLIVAANDGVKPQTKESIAIIKDSTAKPIVVINKCDLPNTDIEKIKRELASEGISVEGMGGEIPVVEVSGKTGKGIPDLLDMINLVIEVEGLQNRGKLLDKVLAKGFVLESVKEKSRGNVSTVVVTQGSIKKGDFIGYEANKEIVIERVKGLISEEGEHIKGFETGCGGKILGLSNILPLGSEIYILEENDKKILHPIQSDEETPEVVVEVEEETVVEEKPTEEGAEPDPEVSFEEFFQMDSNEPEDEVKLLAVMIKSGSEGSLEALQKSLAKIKVEGAELNIIDQGIGDVTIKDIEKAHVTKSIILGFEVGMERNAKELAKKYKVLVRSYAIIYKLIDEIEEALNLLSQPGETEEEIGKAVIKAIFTLSDGQTVLGNRVTEGVLKKSCKCYIVRDDDILAEGRIKSLKINKKDLTQVDKGTDCGVILDVSVDAEEGDEIYCYKIVK
ncbi:GTP-binding protein [bacterium]|nr:GTP-binding protein [bacterium]